MPRPNHTHKNCEHIRQTSITLVPRENIPMNIPQAIQRSLSTSAAIGGTQIFSTVLIKEPKLSKELGAGDKALEYYNKIGFSGDRSKKNVHGYTEVIRSLNSEPPWVEKITMDESHGRISPERERELRPLTSYVKDTGEDVLIERFREHLLESERNFQDLFKSNVYILHQQAQSQNLRV